ncbi:MAG: TonB-dependent receptor [Pseudomonadota bacterium]
MNSIPPGRLVRPFSVVLGATGLVLLSSPLALGQEVEEVLVIGEKTERGLQDVVASVAVATGEVIDREPLANLYDVVDRIPNVSSSFGGLGFSIRGIDQRGIAGSGLGQTLTVYVDDAPLGNFTTFFGPLSAWDLGQVEVYRGPQSTNFGRNALAGAIYVRTRDPSYETDVRTRLEAGNNGLLQGAIAGGTALIEDKLAFRASFNHRETDGFVDNTFLDAPADATELTEGRLKFLFDPTATLRIISTTSYTENFAGEDGVPFENGRDREVAYDTPGREGTQTLLQSLNIDWQINERFALQSITSYQNSDYVRTEDFDLTPAPIAALDRTGEDVALAQELRLKYAGDRLSGVAGFYFVDTSVGFVDEFTVPVTLIDPNIPLDNLVTRVGETDNDATNLAFFMDGQWSMGDRWDLLFGVRLDREEQDNATVTTTDILGELPPGFEFLEALEGDVVETTDADFSAVLPKLGVRWHVSEDANVAFTVQRAYRAGGSAINFVTGEVEDFDPEFLINYELAWRSVWLDGRMTWNANVFYADWTDQQVQVPLEDLPQFSRTINAGESRLWGVETDVAFAVSRHLDVYGSIGYVDTQFTDFPNAAPPPDSFDGNDFPYAPELTLNAGVSYDRGRGVFGGIDVNYQSEAQIDQNNFAQDFVEERTLINARIGYAFADHYRLSIYARNLLDEDYFALANATSNFARLGDRRIVAIRFDSNF